MLYFFKDSKSSLISKLLLKSYTNPANIFFVDGAGNMKEKVLKALERSKEFVVAFLDSVPNNEQVLNNYNDLVEVSGMFPDRLIPMPIVCAEYYFLKSLLVQPVYKDTNLIEFCLSKQFYRDLPELVGHDKHAVTFERFCKFLCRDYLHVCCYIRTRGKTPEDVRIYNKKDCRCSDCLSGCVDMPVLEKSRRLLAQYPCVPMGVHYSSGRGLSWGELKSLHRKLVTEFNDWVELYRSCDHTGSGFYETMDCIYT